MIFILLIPFFTTGENKQSLNSNLWARDEPNFLSVECTLFRLHSHIKHPEVLGILNTLYFSQINGAALHLLIIILKKTFLWKNAL